MKNILVLIVVLVCAPSANANDIDHFDVDGVGFKTSLQEIKKKYRRSSWASIKLTIGSTEYPDHITGYNYWERKPDKYGVSHEISYSSDGKLLGFHKYKKFGSVKPNWEHIKKKLEQKYGDVYQKSRGYQGSNDWSCIC